MKKYILRFIQIPIIISAVVGLVGCHAGDDRCTALLRLLESPYEMTCEITLPQGEPVQMRYRHKPIAKDMAECLAPPLSGVVFRSDGDTVTASVDGLTLPMGGGLSRVFRFLGGDPVSGAFPRATALSDDRIAIDLWQIETGENGFPLSFEAEDGTFITVLEFCPETEEEK